MSETPPEETPIENPSILGSIKASLGVPPGSTAFDQMILMHINSALSTLSQLGAGPDGGLYVTSNAQTWEDFMGTNPELNMIKSYMHLRVRMLFDPPDIGFVLTAMKDQILEMESRINMLVDNHVEPYIPNALTVVAGRPFSQTIRVKNIRSIWATTDELEVRAQLRSGTTSTDPLIYNLHKHMTYAYDADDLVITLFMTGAQTRVLLAREWSPTGHGYFNIVISDVGTTDSRAIVVPLITLVASDTTVRAAGLE